MARIIRGRQRDATSEEPSPLRPQATRIVRASQQRALVDAEQLLCEARQRADAEAQVIVEAARQRATEILVAAEQNARDALEDANDELLTLAIRIAEKLVAGQLQIAPETMVRIVARSIRAASASRQLIVRVNPEDLPQLDVALAQLQQTVGQETLLVLEPDDGIDRGGCVVESDSGQVDGRLETQLEAIRRALSPDERNDRVRR